jgi:hypothetical protein
MMRHNAAQNSPGVMAACRHPRTGQIGQGQTHADAWLDLARQRAVSRCRLIRGLQSRYGPAAVAESEGFVDDAGFRPRSG